MAYSLGDLPTDRQNHRRRATRDRRLISSIFDFSPLIDRTTVACQPDAWQQRDRVGVAFNPYPLPNPFSTLTLIPTGTGDPFGLSVSILGPSTHTVFLIYSVLWAITLLTLLNKTCLFDSRAPVRSDSLFYKQLL